MARSNRIKPATEIGGGIDWGGALLAGLGGAANTALDFFKKEEDAKTRARLEEAKYQRELSLENLRNKRQLSRDRADRAHDLELQDRLDDRAEASSQTQKDVANIYASRKNNTTSSGGLTANQLLDFQTDTAERFGRDVEKIYEERLSSILSSKGYESDELADMTSAEQAEARLNAYKQSIASVYASRTEDQRKIIDSVMGDQDSYARTLAGVGPKEENVFTGLMNAGRRVMTRVLTNDVESSANRKLQDGQSLGGVEAVDSLSPEGKGLLSGSVGEAITQATDSNNDTFRKARSAIQNIMISSELNANRAEHFAAIRQRLLDEGFSIEQIQSEFPELIL